MKAIVFENRRQAILFGCELEGQLSDGHWENADPVDHWLRIVGLPLYINIHDKNVGCLNFTPKIMYNFADGFLVKIVGDRMIDFVRFYMLCPNFPVNYNWEVFHLLGRMKDDDKESFLNHYSYDRDTLITDLERLTQIINQPAISELSPHAVRIRG